MTRHQRFSSSPFTAQFAFLPPYFALVSFFACSLPLSRFLLDREKPNARNAAQVSRIVQRRRRWENDSSLGPQFTSRQVIANGRTTWYRCLATGLRWRKYLDGRITVAHIYSHCSRAFPLFDSCELTIAPSPRQLISHRNPSPCQLCQFRSLRNPAIFLAGWRLPDPSYAVERDRQIATNCATPFRGRSNRSARVS